MKTQTFFVSSLLAVMCSLASTEASISCHGDYSYGEEVYPPNDSYGPHGSYRPCVPSGLHGHYGPYESYGPSIQYGPPVPYGPSGHYGPPGHHGPYGPPGAYCRGYRNRRPHRGFASDIDESISAPEAVVRDGGYGPEDPEE